MATFITLLPTSGSGIRLAVEDLIDVAGVPTTAGSRALADAAPAARDAPCLPGARAAGARIFPPPLEAAMGPGYAAFTSPVNLAGFPALALPVPTGRRLPASMLHEHGRRDVDRGPAG